MIDEYKCSKFICPLEVVNNRLDKNVIRDKRKFHSNEVNKRRIYLEELRNQKYINVLNSKEKGNTSIDRKNYSKNTDKVSQHVKEVQQRREYLEEQRIHNIKNEIAIKEKKINKDRISKGNIELVKKQLKQAEETREYQNKLEHEKYKCIWNVKNSNADIRLENIKNKQNMKINNLKVKKLEQNEKVTKRREHIIKNKYEAIQNNIEFKDKRCEFILNNYEIPSVQNVIEKTWPKILKQKEERCEKGDAHTTPNNKVEEMTENEFEQYLNSVTNKFRIWSAERIKYLQLLNKSKQNSICRGQHSSISEEIFNVPFNWEQWEIDTRNKIDPPPRWQIIQAQKDILNKIHNQKEKIIYI